MNSELLTFGFGLIGVFALIAGGGYTILTVCQSQIRLCERHSAALVDSLRKETEARLEAIRTEFHQRLENLRMETKDDRHNYVDKIDGVLAELRGDIQSVDRAVATLSASLDTAMRLKVMESE